MNLLIFFIIILTIILIVCYYNVETKNSASLILALPLLGAMQYMNTREECYNSREYEYLKKRGIIGSNEEEEIKKLKDENDNIIKLISKYDSLPELEEKFKKLETNDKEFNNLNKYFLFKNDIIDPKILPLIGDIYKTKTIGVINTKFKLNLNKDTTVSKQDKNNARAVIQNISNSDLTNKNIIKGIIAYINTMLSINASDNKMVDYLNKYNEYDFHLKNYKNKFYDEKNIQIFNNLLTDVIQTSSNKKQLYYLINIQKNFRNGKINKLEGFNNIKDQINAIIADNLKENNIISIYNSLIYSLFILYNVNLKKISDIKEQEYIKINKINYEKTLDQLKKEIKKKLKDENINNQILTSPLNSMTALPLDLINSIKTFDIKSLKAQLEEEYTRLETENEENDILDEISIINQLIKKYEDMRDISNDIAATIYGIKYKINNATPNDKIILCYNSVENLLTKNNFESFINNLSNINIDTLDLNTIYINYINTYLEKDINKSYSLYTQDIKKETYILKKYIPIYKELLQNKFNNKNIEINDLIQLLISSKSLDITKLIILHLKDLENNKDIVCTDDNKIILRENIQYNIRLLNNILKKKENKYEESKLKLELLKSKINSSNEDNLHISRFISSNPDMLSFTDSNDRKNKLKEQKQTLESKIALLLQETELNSDQIINLKKYQLDLLEVNIDLQSFADVEKKEAEAKERMLSTLNTLDASKIPKADTKPTGPVKEETKLTEHIKPILTPIDKSEPKTPAKLTQEENEAKLAKSEKQKEANSVTISDTSIKYSDEDKRKIKEFNTTIDDINSKILQMIISTDTMFKKYKTDELRYSYLTLFKDNISSNPVLQSDILDIIKNKEYTLLGKYLTTTSAYMANSKPSNSQIYKYMYEKKIFHITEEEYDTKIKDRKETHQSKLNEIIQILITEYTISDNDKTKFTNNINNVLKICQSNNLNNKLINEKLKDNTTVLANFNTFYQSISINEFNIENVLNSFNILNQQYVPNAINCLNNYLIKGDENLKQIKDNLIHSYSAIIDGNNNKNILNFCKIEDINNLICLSNTITSLNIDLFKLYLKNNKIKEMYKIIVPFEEYINLNTQSLKDQITLLENQKSATNGQIIELEAKLSTAKNELAQRQSDFKAEMDRVNSTSAQNYRLIEEQLNASRSNVQQLEADKERLDKESKSINKQLEEINNLNKQLEEEKSTLEKTLNEQKTQIDKDKNTISRLESENGQKKIELDQLNTNLINKQNDNKALEGEKSQLKSRLTEIEQDLSSYTAKNQTLVSEKQRLNAQIAELERKLIEAGTDKDRLINESQQNSTSLSDKQQNIERLNNTINQITSDLQEKQTKLNNMEETVRSRDSTIQTLTTEAQLQIEKIAVIERDLADNQNTIMRLENEKNAINDELLQCKADLKQAKIDIKTMIENYDVDKAKLEATNKDLAIAIRNNEVLIADKNKVKADLVTWKESHAKWEAQNKTLKNKLKNIQDELKITNTKLAKAIEERDSANTALLSIQDELTNTSEQDSNNIKELNKVNAVLRIQLILYKKRYNDCQSNHNKYVTNTNDLIKNVNNLLNKIHGNTNSSESNKDDFESIKIKLEDTMSKLENNKESLDKIVDDIKNIIVQNPNFTDENVVEEMKKTNDKIILVTNDIIFRILVTLIKTAKDKDQTIKDLEDQLKTQKDKTIAQEATYSTNLLNKESEINNLTQEHQRSLEKLNIEHQQKIDKLTRELEQSKQDDITNKTNILTLDCNTRLTELTAVYERNLSVLNEQLEQEKRTTQSCSKYLKEKNTQIERLKMSLADLEDQIQALNNKHINELNEVDTRYNTYKTDLESKHAEELQKIINSHAELNTTYMADKTEQTTLIAQLEAEKTALIAKLEADKEKIIAKFESERAELIIKHNAEKADLEAEKTELKTEKDRIISEHNAEKAELKNTHATALQLLSSTKDTEKEQLISEHKTALQGINNDSSSFYLKLKTDHDKEVNNLKQAYNTQTQLLKQDYNTKIEQIKKTCVEDTDNKLKKLKDELEQQYESNKQSLKEELERQYNNNLADNNRTLEQQHTEITKAMVANIESTHAIALNKVIAEYEQKAKKEIIQEQKRLEEIYNSNINTIKRTHKKSIELKEADYEQKLASIQAEKFKLEQKIQEINTLNDDKIASLTLELREKIKELETNYQIKIKDYEKEYINKLNALKASQSYTQDTILRGFSNNQEKTHKKEINDLELEHTNKIKELELKYQSEIKQIQMKSSITKKELDSDINALQAELTNRSLYYSDSIINKGKENDKLQEEVNGYKNITSKMADQILDLEYHKEKLEADINELKAKHKLEIENLNMLNNETQAKENKNYQDSINILSEKIVYLNKNILKLKNENISLSEANSNYQMNISELNTKNEILNSENISYKESNLSLNQNNNDLRNTIISLETINRQYKNDISELNRKIEIYKVSSDMMNEITLNASLEKINGDYKKQIEELKKVHNTEIENLKQTKLLASNLATSYISTGLNNTVKTKNDIENEYNNKLAQLEEKHKNDINQYQMNINKLESLILNLQNINKQLKTDNDDYKNKLENEIKDRNVLDIIISNYLQKYEESEIGLKDAIFKNLKPGALISKENVINTKLYAILNRHKDIINELNGCKSLGKLGMQEIIKLIKKVKNNLVDKIVVNIDDIDSIDLNNIKFDKDQAKYLNKLDELLNKLIEEKFNLAKENKDLQEINNQLTDEYMIYIKDKETKIEKLNTEITEQTNIIKELNDNIDNITTEYINRTNNLTSQEFNEQIKILKTNINIKNALIKEKEDILNRIEKEYKVQIELLKEENTTLQSKCDADKIKYEKEINMLKRAYSIEQKKLNATIAKYDQYYTLTENDKKEINKQIIDEKARIDLIYKEESQKLNDMNTEIEKLKFQLQSKELELQNCLEDKKKLKQDILKIKSDKATIENENKKIKLSLEDELFNVKKLKEENEELKKVINEMQYKCNKSSNNDNEIIYEDSGEDIYIYVDKNAIKPVNINKYRESGTIFTLEEVQKRKQIKR